MHTFQYYSIKNKCWIYLLKIRMSVKEHTERKHMDYIGSICITFFVNKEGF